MRFFMLLATSVLLLANAAAAEKETRFFEMRTYYAAPGKLEALQARFRDHTMAIFEKHGMVNIGYWLPLTNSQNKIVYLLAYPSLEAREQAWKDFWVDPEWQAVVKESEKDGKLVSKAESVFLTATDFSPIVKPERSNPPRVFELRTYKATAGKLPELVARFRNHTAALFAKHGMTQFGYFLPTEQKDGAGDTLVYILVHKSPEACAESFKAFRADPAWVKAKADSEVNGPLTVKDGVQSVLMAPTDFSPAK
jgi:NIPSNAP